MLLRRRRIPGWAVLGAATLAAMIVLPAGGVASLRLTVAGALSPVRSISESAGDGMSRVAGPSDAEIEAQVRVEYYQALVEKLAAQLAEANARNEALMRTRTVVPRSAELIPVGVLLPGDASGWGRTLVVDAGSEHGITPGLAVMWETHLVGRIVEVARWTSRVQLTTDPDFRAGVLAVPDLSGDAEARLLVAEGTGEGAIRLMWALDGDPTEVGWMVVTAGDPDVALPRGAIVGRVASASRRGSPYRDIEVEPGIRFDRLSSVIVVRPVR